MDLAILIGYLSMLFIFGAFISKIGEKLNIPDIPLLLIFGLIVGPLLNIVSLKNAQDIFQYVSNIGLMIILLGGALEMRWIVLKKVLPTVAKLDIIGLLGLFSISGLLFNLIFKMPLLSPIGYLYGAIVCATDPATLMPVFSKSKINPKIALTLEAESVFNDPLGIVITTIILSSIGLAENLNPILNFISLAIGGGILGIIGGKLYELIVSKWDFKDFVAPLCLGFSFLLWYFGEGIFPKLTGGYEISGFMAIAIMGLYLGNTLINDRKLSKCIEEIDELCSRLSTIFRILIFVFLGASISLSVLLNYWLLGLLCALGSIFIARPIGVFIATSIPPASDIKERIYYALEGPRGVVPAALSATVYSLIVSNPGVIPQSITKYMPAESIANAVLVASFITILVSVILQASWAEPLGKKLFKY